MTDNEIPPGAAEFGAVYMRSIESILNHIQTLTNENNGDYPPILCATMAVAGMILKNTPGNKRETLLEYMAKGEETTIVFTPLSPGGEV